MADTFIQFYDNNGVPVRIRAIDNLDAEHTHSLAVESIAPMQAVVAQPNPDLLLANANMQVGNVDVSGANPVPTTVSAALPAGANALGKIIAPTFSESDSLTRPANTTPYAANKSINCNLTVTAISYVLKVVTLTSNGHGLVAGDRITVAGILSGASVTNVDGNWVVSSSDTNTFTFTVASQPTGTTPQTGLTITGAIAKLLSFDVAGVAGGGIILSGLSISLQGVAMLGAVRAWIYVAQVPVLVDQSTFTLLTANDANRKKYIDLYPITEGTGSDVAFAQVDLWREIKCAAGDTRLYIRLVAEGASTPVSGGVITVRMSGVQLLG
jgi:hypothetical protein